MGGGVLRSEWGGTTGVTKRDDGKGAEEGNEWCVYKSYYKKSVNHCALTIFYFTNRKQIGL